MFDFFKKKNATIQNLAEILHWSESGDWYNSKLSTSLAVSCSTVFSCVRVRAEIGASLPIALYRAADKTKTSQLDHPASKLLAQPNAWQTKSDLFQTLIAHLDLRGNAYLQKTYVGGTVRELIPLNPDLVVVKQNNDASLSYETRNKEGKVFKLKQNDVIHFRSLSTDGYMGISPLDALTGVISTAIEQQKYQGSMIRNGAKPSGIISIPDKFTAEALKNYKKKIMEATSGSNAGGTLVLDNGAEFKQVSLSPQQLEALEQRKFTRSEIAGGFRVPLHMINDYSGATFSNIENLALQFYQFALMPLLTAIEQRLSLDLLDEDERGLYYFEHNPDGILRGDIKSRYEAYTMSIMHGVRSPNEVRKLENLPPRGDGLGDAYFYPANLMPADRIGEPQTETEKAKLKLVGSSK